MADAVDQFKRNQEALRELETEADRIARDFPRIFDPSRVDLRCRRCGRHGQYERFRWLCHECEQLLRQSFSDRV